MLLWNTAPHRRLLLLAEHYQEAGPSFCPSEAAVDLMSVRWMARFNDQSLALFVMADVAVTMLLFRSS